MWHLLICDNTFFLISLFKMRHVIFSLNEYVVLYRPLHILKKIFSDADHWLPTIRQKSGRNSKSCMGSSSEDDGYVKHDLSNRFCCVFQGHGFIRSTCFLAAFVAEFLHQFKEFPPKSSFIHIIKCLFLSVWIWHYCFLLSFGNTLYRSLKITSVPCDCPTSIHYFFSLKTEIQCFKLGWNFLTHSIRKLLIVHDFTQPTKTILLTQHPWMPTTAFTTQVPHLTHVNFVAVHSNKINIQDFTD